MSAEDSGRPYTQTREGNIIHRTFSKDVDTTELKWHKDQYDRKVTIIKSGGWKFQKDDELPFDLVDGDAVFIRKESWHRVIKGDGDLVILIEEIFEDS